MANSRGYYLRFPCPACGATQKVLPAQVGTEIRCAECPAVIVVPSLEELTAADRAHNHQRKTVGAVRKTPSANRGASPKSSPPPLELNIIRGQIVSFACPVCHHMMRSTAEELGHVIMCPHCYSPVTVGGEQYKRPPTEKISLVLEDDGEDEYQLAGEKEPPSPVSNQSLTPEHVEAEEDEYRLSDVEAVPRQPPPLPLSEDEDELEIDLAPAGERGDGAKPPRRERARLLQDHDPTDDAWVIQERRNRVGLEDRIAAAVKNRKESEPPDHPFLSGVFGFLLYPSSGKRWLGLSAGTALVYFLVANSVASGISGGAELFLSLIFAAMAASAALLLLMVEAVAALAIVQDTAAGADEVEGWPDFNFVDWAGQAFYFINAVAFSAAPGFLLASLMDQWGSARWAAPGVTAVILFPIVLLSQLDGTSPFSVLTPGVLKGAFKSPRSWMAFYTASLFTLSAATALGVLALWLLPWDGAPAAIVLGALATTAVMVECRLIGRLAWFCEETLPAVEEESAEEADADEDREMIK